MRVSNSTPRPKQLSDLPFHTARMTNIERTVRRQGSGKRGADVGDKNHLKVFTTREAAEAWLANNDPEGVAFAYEVLGR